VPHSCGVESLVTVSVRGSRTATAGAAVSTLKVCSALNPTPASASDCSACTLYVPSGSGTAGATDQVAPVRAVVSVWTSSSGAPATGRMIFTVTSVASPGALPAAPPRSGVVSLVASPSIGVVSVTAGSVVSTVQVALAGVGSMFPAGSTARTWKVCVLSDRPA
jgi:hypothetical protein